MASCCLWFAAGKYLREPPASHRCECGVDIGERLSVGHWKNFKEKTEVGTYSIMVGFILIFLFSFIWILSAAGYHAGWRRQNLRRKNALFLLKFYLFLCVNSFKYWINRWLQPHAILESKKYCFFEKLSKKKLPCKNKLSATANASSTWGQLRGHW